MQESDLVPYLALRGLVQVQLVVVWEEKQSALGLTGIPDGSNQWFGCICSTGLPIGHSSFSVLSSVSELVGILGWWDFPVILVEFLLLLGEQSSSVEDDLSFLSKMVSTCLLVCLSSVSISSSVIPPLS